MYDVVDRIDIRAPVDTGPGEAYVGDVDELLPRLPRYDAVFHLAATVGGRAGIEASPLAVAHNLALDLAFFNYVARTRPDHAVYLSSSAVYPDVSLTPTEETVVHHHEESVDPDAAAFGRPDGTYGWVKLTGEHLAHVVRCRFGVPVMCYRPFTVYGPHQPLDYPVAAIASRALAHEDPLTLWGSGRQVRDFVYVDDAAAAIAFTHRHASRFEAVNICTGIGTDFMTVAATVADLVGYRPRLVGDRSKPTGVAQRVGSPARLLTWAEPQSTLKAGLSRLLEHLTGREHG